MITQIESTPIDFSKLSEVERQEFVAALRLLIPWMIESVEDAEINKQNQTSSSLSVTKTSIESGTPSSDLIIN